MSAYESEDELQNLTMPKHLWCPRCGVHNRSMDVYGNPYSEVGPPKMLNPLCPVCQDEEDKELAEEESKYQDEGGINVVRIREAGDGQASE